MKATRDYYNKNAGKFIENTKDLDMSDCYQRFESHLKRGSHLLDAGCGSGRDTVYFLRQGYRVSAMDASEEMCRLASDLTGIEVAHKSFNEISEHQVYDGIWACASLLHLPKVALSSVFRVLQMALKKNGVIYCSFKLGDFEGEINGRYFTDLNEAGLGEVLKATGISMDETWITSDVRPDRPEEMWLNAILITNNRECGF